MNKPPPTFDSKFLRELAGGLVFKAGETLFESHAVISADWESPVLVGKVEGAGDLYEPQLNLRSTVFADNRCSCPEGRKRKVCAHAVAAAIHYQACKHEQVHEEAAQAAEDIPKAEESETAAQPASPS